MTHWCESPTAQDYESGSVHVNADAGNNVLHRRYHSGIQVLWSETADTQALCTAVASHALGKEEVFCFIWFSSSRHKATDIIRELSLHAGRLNYCGCSTSGEVTPTGMQDDGFIAILLPRRWFTVATLVMDRVSTLGMESIARDTSEFRIGFLGNLDEKLTTGGDRGGLFAINLIDGLSYSEETVTLAIDRGLDGIPLIGGSAGDNLKFERTWQICNGKAHSDAAVLALVHCQLPCQVYSNNNFVPTEHKLVVTEADPDRRKVIEFNAEPAALAYANAIGMDPDQLDAGSFASCSVIVRFGGQYYCRSIQQLNDDLSLTFFCAIDNGLVLTVARSEGMVASSRQAIDTIEADIGPLDMLFGFDCIYRKLDAQHRQTTHRISALYQEKNFIGFNTYGEQYNSMHINQTFTGVAIGLPPGSPNQ